MALPDKFRLLSPLCVEKAIEGTLFKFYTNSVGVAARLSEMAQEVIGHVSVLMNANTDRDQGSIFEEITDPSGAVMKKTSMDPINPQLVEVRMNRRKQAMQGAIKALLDGKNRLVVGELLMDSLRDEFPRGKPISSQDAQDFVNNMDIPVLMQFLTGWGRANAKVVGDLGKALKDSLGAQFSDVLASVAPEAADVTAG